MFRKIYTLIIFAGLFTPSANAQWQAINLSRPGRSFPSTLSQPNANTIWASYSIVSTGGQIGGSATVTNSSDGGVTWTKQTIFSQLQGLQVANVSAIDEDTAYIAVYNGTTGKGGGIWKTTDGGIVWNRVSSGTLFNSQSFPNLVHFWNAAEGIAMGDATDDGSGLGAFLEIYTTSDYGNTWNRVPRSNIPFITQPPVGIVNHYAVFENTIWAQVYDGDPAAGALQYIYKSTDKGLTWEATRLQTFNESLQDIVFVDELNGITCDLDVNNQTPTLYRTSDGGETWSEVIFSGPFTGAFISAVPGTNTLVCSNGIYVGPQGTSYSTDLGSTWTAIDLDDQGLLQHSEVSFFDATHGWTGQYRILGSLPGGMFKWDESSQILPITLSYFSVTKNTNRAILKWQTESEFNFSHFIIERSADAKNYQEIAKIYGTGGSNKVASYIYEDLQFEKGLNYYRLKLVNKDGSYNYSTAENVDFATLSSIRVYPIPAKDKITVEGVSTANATVYTIIDINGKTVKQVTASGSSYSINIETLATGSYYLLIKNGTNTTTQKFIKQ